MLNANNPSPSAWQPLSQPLFRALWIATVISNVGTWVHEVGAGWLMVTLDADPLMVSLVQAATTLPIFLLALPGGALADIVDRRRYLLFTQVWMLLSAMLLAVATAVGWIGAWSLLALTFALACGAALNTPAWAAMLPEIVPRAQLQSAIALNSLGINLARAVGPALAGVVVAATGPQAAFLLNALSFAAVIVVLLRWRREAHARTLPAEQFLGAIRAGVRYVRQATALQQVMVRSAAFFLFSTATWALLPLVARATGGGAGSYGLLLSGLGAGAVCAALLLPRVRARYSRDVLVRSGSVLFAAAGLGVAVAGSLPLLLPAMFFAGAAWLTVLSTLHVSAQLAVPQWVRARALSVYLMVFAVCMSGGAIIWGAMASRWGVPIALVVAAAGLLVGIWATWRDGLGADDVPSRTESARWPRPQQHAEIAPERGPVQVHIEYTVASSDSAAFIAAAQALRRIRRRDGALSWGLFEDAAVPGRYVETFLVESWAEHLRQHDRAVAEDAAAVDRVRAFHRGECPPRVAHWIAVNTADDVTGDVI